jgi:hypothetical protein
VIRVVSDNACLQQLLTASLRKGSGIAPVRGMATDLFAFIIGIIPSYPNRSEDGSRPSPPTPHCGFCCTAAVSFTSSAFSHVESGSYFFIVMLLTKVFLPRSF